MVPARPSPTPPPPPPRKTRCPTPQRARKQVLLHGEVLKNAPALEHVEDPASHDLRRVESIEPDAVQLDRPFGDLAFLGAQKSGYRLERRALAGPIRAEQRDDPPIRDLE